MESPTRRRIDVPRPSADAGLAEWTSKIKALQRDVDADEELEQRKLEEEIRASRLARSRRSGQFAIGATGAGGRASMGVGADDERDTTPADALRKLSGEPASTNTVSTSPTSAPYLADRKPSTMSPTSTTTTTPGGNVNANAKQEPMSLAAFIGGRATGPRLNRPQPQADAHDPKLFEQRTRADIVAPHPVFGSGGVALMGLAGKGREVVGTAKTPEKSANRGVSMPVREVKENVKPATTNYGVPTTASANMSARSTVPTRNWARERTVSSPSPSPYAPPKTPIRTSPPPAVVAVGSPGVRNRVESLYAHANRSTERVAAPPALRGSKSTDRMAQQQRPAAPAKPDALRRPTQPVSGETPPLRTSIAGPSLSASTSTPPVRTQTPTKPASTSPPISVPSLARSIHPQQRPTSAGPQIPLSKKPAPAFLKPTQQKDLTPSLSRLQGRGFVQSFVKLSSEIEAAATASGNASSPDRSAATPSPKRNSVHGRWNPPNSNHNTSPNPSPSPSPISAPPLRKAKTFDVARSSTQNDAGVTSESVGRPAPALKPKPASLAAASSAAKSSTATPTKAKSVPTPAPVPAPGEALPLGSSNTLISYIKPTKTGDAPPTDSAERSKTPSRQQHGTTGENGFDNNNANELGVRPRSRSSKTRSPSPTKSTSAVAPRASMGTSSGTGSGTRAGAGTARSDLASSVASSGRPLSHPTKDRAKLRRKGAGGQTASRTEEREEVDDHLVPAFSQPAEPTQAPARAREITPASKPELSVSLALPHDEQPQRKPSPSPVQARGENVRRLQDTWSTQGPIGVKPLRKPSLASPSPNRSSFGPGISAPQMASKVSKRPLPGLAPSTSSTMDATGGVPPPSPPLTPPLSVNARQERAKSPSSPAKHGRIPSTGSRATVMDVAQAFSANANIITPTAVPAQPKSPVAPTSPRSPVGDERQRDPGGWNEPENERTITPAIIKAERRRSTYEKYANFTLPVLPEEKTPVSSPVGTLKEGADAPARAVDVFAGVPGEKDNINKSEPSKGEVRIEKPVPPKKPDFVRAPSKTHIDVVDEPVPAINAAKIWDASPPRFKPDLDAHSVSVEVLSVAGGNATEISKGVDNVYVFYDSEALVIVQRAKSRSSGLVVSKVWAWIGKKAEVGEREEKKMQELAKRYGTGLMKCDQCSEPQELVHVLGGTLNIRQGKRSLWSSDNTTMHVVRSLAGVILIDEVDLDIRNLCSGFSYCISLLDTLWVWYGCGSFPAERNSALRYAQTLCINNDEKKVVEAEEGEEDEMFWMFLGEEGYASADYWKWRKDIIEKNADPRFWRVDCTNSGSEIKELETFPPASDVSKCVLVIHLAYEIFTLVGSGARGRRYDIKLGLTLAQELSSYTARSKPFRPPVHVLIFPSQIPLDLRAAIRGLDTEAIHGSEEIPDHMNLLNLNDAWKQLNQKEWDQTELEDGNMMPLGLTPQR